MLHVSLCTIPDTCIVHHFCTFFCKLWNIFKTLQRAGLQISQFPPPRFFMKISQIFSEFYGVLRNCSDFGRSDAKISDNYFECETYLWKIQILNIYFADFFLKTVPEKMYALNPPGEYTQHRPRTAGGWPRVVRVRWRCNAILWHSFLLPEMRYARTGSDRAALRIFSIENSRSVSHIVLVEFTAWCRARMILYLTVCRIFPGRRVINPYSIQRFAKAYIEKCWNIFSFHFYVRVDWLETTSTVKWFTYRTLLSVPRSVWVYSVQVPTLGFHHYCDHECFPDANAAIVWFIRFETKPFFHLFSFLKNLHFSM